MLATLLKRSPHFLLLPIAVACAPGEDAQADATEAHTESTGDTGDGDGEDPTTESDEGDGEDPTTESDEGDGDDPTTESDEGDPTTGGDDGARPSDCPNAAMHSYRVSQADFDAQMFQFSSFIEGGSGLAQGFTATADAELEAVVLFLFEPSLDVGCEQEITLFDLDAQQELRTWSVDIEAGVASPPLVLPIQPGTLQLSEGTQYQLRVVACPDTNLIQMRRLGWVHNVTSTYPDSALHTSVGGTTWTPVQPGLTTHFEVCIADGT